MGSGRQEERGYWVCFGCQRESFPSQVPGWWGSLGSVPLGAASDLLSPLSICYYGRLFWEWGDGIRVHESQKPQDPDKLSKEDVLSFIQTHSA